MQKPQHAPSRLKSVAVMALAVSLSVSLWFNYRLASGGPEDGGEPQRAYPRIDQGRWLIDDGDITANFQPLREDLTRITNLNIENVDVSLYFEFLNNGANIVVNKDLSIWPVSLAKLPLAMVVMKKIELGEFSIHQKHRLEESDIDAYAGVMFRRFKAGDELEIGELIRYSLENSDNTAYHALFRLTTPTDRQALVEEIGLTQLFDEGQKVSAKEYSRIFRALFFASYLDRETSDMLLSAMSKASFNGYLGAAIPTHVEFSHKYGRQLAINVFSDSGIVYVEGRPYLLTVMVHVKNNRQDPEGTATKIMHEVSRSVYEYVTGF